MAVQIMVLNRGEAERFKPLARHAYISVADSDQQPAALPQAPSECVEVLRLAFDDVLNGDEQGRPIVAFDDDHAKQIWMFWDRVREKVDLLIIHCNGGFCRSPAIAAAIALTEFGDDARWFATKRPNTVVYRTLLKLRSVPSSQGEFAGSSS